MKREEIKMGIYKVVSDFICAGGSWLLAYLIRPYTDLIPFKDYHYPNEALPEMVFFLKFTISACLVLIILFSLLSFYYIGEKFDWPRVLFKIIFGVFLWGMLIISYFSLIRHEPFFSRIMLFHAQIFSIILIFISRILINHQKIRLWQNGEWVQKIVLFGSGQQLAILQKILPLTPPYQIVASTNNYQELENLIDQKKPDEIWQIDLQSYNQPERSIQELTAEKQLEFRFMPNIQETTFGKMEFEIIGGVPIFHPIISRLGGWGRVIKRIFDIFSSIISLIILSPFLILIALAIKIDSKGSIFYIKERVGRNGQIFKMIKFRSMIENAEKEQKKLLAHSHRKDGPLFKIKNDPRITKVGKFLRRFSLDELPNLINVLTGEMSLTGPRPHFPEEVAKFSSWQKRVLQVRPGVTGLAQVSGRSDLSFDKEIKLDLFFIQNWNFILEFKIILKTIWIVLHGKGAD